MMVSAANYYYLALLFSILAESTGALQEGHAAAALVPVEEAPARTGAAKPYASLTNEAAAAAVDGTPLTISAGDYKLRSLGGAARYRPPPKLIRGRSKHSCVHNRPGACEAVSPGQVCCFHHFCADLASEELNCGKCGNRCKMPEGCCCSGECVNTSGDPANCGKCGKACAPGEFCTFGMCGYA